MTSAILASIVLGAVTVESRPGYNSWPMIQAVGGKLVCAYSRGSAHTIGEGARGVLARMSPGSRFSASR